MGKLEPNIDVSLFKIDAEQMVSGKRVGDIKPVPLEQLEKEFNSFERIDLDDVTHKEVLRTLFSDYLIDSTNEADRQLFLSMSRFDRRHSTFVTGCFDNESTEEFRLISHKPQMKDGVKWKTRAGTSPNSTPLVRIFTDDGTIYFIEGHRDALTAILLGLDFVMIPYAGYKAADPSYLQNEVAGREVVFLVEEKAVLAVEEVFLEVKKNS